MPAFWAVVPCGALLLQAGAGLIPFSGEDGGFRSVIEQLKRRPSGFVKV